MRILNPPLTLQPLRVLRYPPIWRIKIFLFAVCVWYSHYPAKPDSRGIGAARDSGRRRKGGHDKCFGVLVAAWKVSPLSLFFVLTSCEGLAEMDYFPAAFFCFFCEDAVGVDGYGVAAVFQQGEVGV